MSKKMTATDELVKFIINLTPAQADKIIKHIDLLKQLSTMSENQMIFTDEFIGRIFGRIA